MVFPPSMAVVFRAAWKTATFEDKIRPKNAHVSGARAFEATAIGQNLNALSLSQRARNENESEDAKKGV